MLQIRVEVAGNSFVRNNVPHIVVNDVSLCHFNRFVSRCCLVVLNGDNSRPNGSVRSFSSKGGIGLVQGKVLVEPRIAVVLKLLCFVICEVAARLTPLIFLQRIHIAFFRKPF